MPLLKVDNVMNIKLIQLYRMTTLTCLSVLLLTGCTTMYEQPIHEINLPYTEEKIDLSVKLVLTDDFRNAKWERISIMGDTRILPIGDNLVHSSINLVRNVFVHPLIPGLETKPEYNTEEAKYLLEPKVVLVEQSFGVFSFSKATTSIGVEWMLTKLNGDTVWVETIKGVAVGKQGNISTAKGHQTKRFQIVLQELFESSQEAFLSSPLLRNLP